MTDPNPELSLSDVTWLTSLARTLTRDGALADDLVQETWLAARKSQPTTGVTRPWLSRVLQRLHLRSLRTERRRTKREQAVSTGEALTATSELVERAELQRTMADCLLGLDEPYRSTLMHVAFEGRSPKEIAATESVSVESVRRRLRKARELFKQRLERKYGRDWKQWYAALLPFAELPLPGEVAAASAASSPGLLSIPLVLGGLLVSHSLLVTLTAVPLLAFGLWFGLADRQDPTPKVEAQTSNQLSGARNATAEDNTPLRREVAAAAAESTEPSTADPAAAPETKTDTFRVSGTVVIQDESGAMLARTNGEFTMRVSKEAEEESIKVAVVNGAWELEIPADREWNIQPYAGLQLDDRPATWTGDSRATIHADTELAFTARWIARHQIAVLDAESRQHLNWVQVTEQAASLDRFCTPGVVREDSIVCRDQRSPIQLTPRTWHDNRFYIGCEGYTWSWVKLDPNQGGRREVLLRRAADLTVRFAPPRRGTHTGPAQFRIYVADDEACEWATATNTRDELRLAGLPPGRYVVEARAHRAAKVARREIDLAVGANWVDLTVPEFRQEMVRVAGVLVMPKSSAANYVLRLQRNIPPTDSKCHVWDSNGAHKTIRLAAMKRVDREFHFIAGELPTGSYSVTVSVWPELDALWQIDCQIEPSGADELRFELPTVAEAYVRLLDAKTSEVITPRTAALGAFFNFKEEIQASFDEAKQLWRLMGTPGHFRGTVTTMAHVPTNIAVELRSEQPAQIEMRLQLRTRLAFDFYDGDVRKPLGLDYYQRCKVAQLRGRTTTSEAGFTTGGLGFHLSEPGTFQVTFPELEGYEPIPDQIVEVQKGEQKRVRVELRTKR